MSGAAARIFKVTLTLFLYYKSKRWYLSLFPQNKALKNVTRKKPRKAATETITEGTSSGKADASIRTQTVENELPFIPQKSSLFHSTTDNSKKVYSSPIEQASTKAFHAKAEHLAEEQGGNGEQLRILSPQKVSL